MGLVLHDRRGYVCDLGSAYGCLKVMNWLESIRHGPIIDGFIIQRKIAHPRILAAAIERLLQSHPSKDNDVACVAGLLIKGLRCARGFAEITQ